MCNACTALLALVDQLEARVEELTAQESYWRYEAVASTLEVIRRDGEVRQLPTGEWERTDLTHPSERANASNGVQLRRRGNR